MSVTSEFYMSRAEECAREAEATKLENVRERLLRSEAAWLSMAGRLQRGEAMRKQDIAEKAASTDILD